MDRRGVLCSLVVVGVLLVVGFFCFVWEWDSDGVLDETGVYCVQQGFSWDVRDGVNGSVGYCVADDGQECVGWEFFYGECAFDGYELCVESDCCHSSSCVWESEAPDCNMSICTMECRTGTTDCGFGHCEVVDGECEVVWDDEI